MQIRNLPRQVHHSNHIRGGVDNLSATAAPRRDVLFRRSIMPPFAPPPAMPGRTVKRCAPPENRSVREEAAAGAAKLAARSLRRK